MQRMSVIVSVLALSAATVSADEFAGARFKGTAKADPIRVENVSVKSAGAAAADVVFDLAWDHSWRAAWEVPAEEHGGKQTLKLENWDAAWAFVKFRGADGNWAHAMLAPESGDHAVPAGAKLELGRTDDGKRGVGVFVYRSARGAGPVAWHGVRLRCLDVPADVQVRVFALGMVYVPQGAFWAGDGESDRLFAQFAAGDSAEPFRIQSEEALTMGGQDPKNLGDRAGRGLFTAHDFTDVVTQTLPAAFPKGYAAFYCMRCELTQQQYVDFLNTLPHAEQAARTGCKPSEAAGTRALAGHGEIREAWRNEVRIAVPGVPDGSETLVIDRGAFVASYAVTKPGAPAVYETAAPHVACNFIMRTDDVAYAAWAGLRPMTELEFEKACRGPLKPVPNEYAWGTDCIAGMDSETGLYKLRNAGQVDETVVWEGENGPDATRGNALTERTMRELDGPLRVGIFATPDSDRVSAGASYWGILDLSGNVVDRAVHVTHATGRAFDGTHGDGGAPQWRHLTEPPRLDQQGLGMRGGGQPMGSHAGGWGRDVGFRVSNRHTSDRTSMYGGSRHFAPGFRAVRTAP